MLLTYGNRICAFSTCKQSLHFAHTTVLVPTEMHYASFFTSNTLPPTATEVSLELAALSASEPTSGCDPFSITSDKHNVGFKLALSSSDSDLTQDTGTSGSQ